MIAIRFPETTVPYIDKEFHSGDSIDLKVKVIIDEPTLTGYKCLVYSVEPISAQVNSSSSS